MPKPKRIGMLLNLNDCYDLEVARGVLRFAKERSNWRLFSRSWLFNPVENFESWHGDGVITRVHERGVPRLLVRPGLPVVDVAGTENQPGYAQVTNDDDRTGYLAGKHLVDCGLENIAFLGARDAGWSAKRLAGVERAVREAGLPAVRARGISSRWSWNKGKFSRLAAWLAGLPKPCGLVATDDPMALKAIQAASTAGLLIPRDLALVVIGNEDVLCALAEPSLTSIACDCQRIGYEAAKRLDRILEGEKYPGDPDSIPPLPLVARESSDVMAVTDAAVAAALVFIREHVTEGINVAEVACHSSLCRRSLELRFRSVRGRSIHDEIRRVRLELAQRYLESGILSTYVAAKVGFSTVQHFHAAFKSQYGVTPSEYAKNYRNYGTMARRHGRA